MLQSSYIHNMFQCAKPGATLLQSTCIEHSCCALRQLVVLLKSANRSIITQGSLATTQWSWQVKPKLGKNTVDLFYMTASAGTQETCCNLQTSMSGLKEESSSCMQLGSDIGVSWVKRMPALCEALATCSHGTLMRHVWHVLTISCGVVITSQHCECGCQAIAIMQLSKTTDTVTHNRCVDSVVCVMCCSSHVETYCVHYIVIRPCRSGL